MTLETQTESALSDYVKKFLLEFKDEKGNFRYVDDIDNMMPSKSKFINIDYNDLVLHPDIESVFGENPDSILEAFSRAIKEILQERLNAMKIASILRENSIPTDIDLSGRALKKQMEQSTNSKFVIIVGPDELSKNMVVVRNMSDRTENKILISWFTL